MNKEELMRAIEVARESHFQKLLAYRKWYQPEGIQLEENFGVLAGLPDEVEWVLEDNALLMQGHAKGLQEMTFIIQAFAHDEDTFGIFYENFALVKAYEPVPFEGLTVIAMPDEVWKFWGGKMADVAWGNDFDHLCFNWMGFYEEKLPTDLGIKITSGKEIFDKDEE